MSSSELNPFTMLLNEVTVFFVIIIAMGIFYIFVNWWRKFFINACDNITSTVLLTATVIVPVGWIVMRYIAYQAKDGMKMNIPIFFESIVYSFLKGCSIGMRIFLDNLYAFGIRVYEDYKRNQ